MSDAQSRFEIYPRQDDEIPPGLSGEAFGWRFRAADGRVLAASVKGHQTDDAAERDIGIFLESLDAFDWSGDAVKPPVLRVRGLLG